MGVIVAKGRPGDTRIGVKSQLPAEWNISTDTFSLLLFVCVTAANIGDRDAAAGMLMRLRRLLIRTLATVSQRFSCSSEKELPSPCTGSHSDGQAIAAGARAEEVGCWGRWPLPPTRTSSATLAAPASFTRCVLEGVERAMQLVDRYGSVVLARQARSPTTVLRPDEMKSPTGG